MCIISQDYPNVIRKSSYVFLQNFSWTAKDLGHDVVIICPLNKLRDNNRKIPYHVVEKTLSGNSVDVFFPKFSGGWYTYRAKYDFVAWATHRAFVNSVERVIRKEKITPDVLYAEFLDPAGTCAGILKNKIKCKAIASFGESSFWTLSSKHYSKDVAMLNSLDGIESVSTENKRRLIKSGIQRDETIIVLPNAIDPKRYYKKDKKLSRKKFGFDQDAFIVSFLGGFIERKGVLRVDEALQDIDGVYIAYAGKGPQLPKSKNTIYCEPVIPEEVSDFLSASDIFVLPTLNEGCCNAIIEAMAAGLPIVSSNLAFNDDILNDKNSIRVNPNDICEIREAVIRLKDDPTLRKEMGEESLKIAKDLSIQKRVLSVISFIDSL